MSYQPKVYTLSHILLMSGMAAFATLMIYMNGTTGSDPGKKWFAETWLLYIGGGATLLIFLFGLTILGTPWYDEETNQQLKAEHDRSEFEWQCKSPEERAIIIADRKNTLLQLTQILQNSQIISNQEELKKNKKS